MTQVSLIICTYNRCALLERTLRTVAAQETKFGLLWETIVVNNNSDDATSQIAAAFEEYIKQFRCVFEAKQGLSYARNRGIIEARGELICFIDDDVQLPKNYVEQAWKEWKNGDWDVAGGRVLPYYEVNPPIWLRRLPRSLYNGPLGLYDRGRENFILDSTDDSFPIGANMLIPRSITDKIGTFNTHLGRSGKSLRSGEDTEFFSRALKHGFSIGYCGKCFLFHFVSKNRLRRRYIIRSKFTSSLAGGGDSLPNNTVIWMGVPRFFWRKLFKAALDLCLAIFPYRRMEAAIVFSEAFGTVIGYLSKTRD